MKKPVYHLSLLFLITVSLSMCNAPLGQYAAPKPAAPVLWEERTTDQSAVLKAEISEGTGSYIFYYKEQDKTNWKSKRVALTKDPLEPAKAIIEIDGLEADTKYEFYAKALNDIGKASERSDAIALLTLLKTPKIKNIETQNHHTIFLEWEKSGDDVTYAIFRSEKDEVISSNNLFWKNPYSINITETSHAFNVIEDGGIPYYYWVQAYTGLFENRENESAISAVEEKAAKLWTPEFTDIRMGVIDNKKNTQNSMTLSWKVVRFATLYEVIYHPMEGSENTSNWISVPGIVGTDGPNNTKIHKIENLRANTQYYFKIRAYNPSGNDGRGNESLFSVPVIGVTLTRSPVPGSFMAEYITPTSITLTWENISPYYNLRISETPQENNLDNKVPTVKVTSSDIPKTIILKENTRYYFSIRALDFSGDSESETDPIFLSHYTILSKQATPVRGAVTDKTVDLTWSAKPGATGYVVDVYDRVSNLLFSTAVEDAHNDKKYTGEIIHVLNYTVRNLLPDTEYLFAVKAVNEDAIAVNGFEKSLGLPSDRIGVTTRLSAPSQLRVAQSYSTSINLSWGRVDKADYYKVFYCEVIDDEVPIFGDATQTGGNITGMGYLVEDLEPASTYCFWVTAHNNRPNQSSESVPVTATTNSSHIIISFENHDDPVLVGMPEYIEQGDKAEYKIIAEINEIGATYQWYLNGNVQLETSSTYIIDQQRQPLGPYTLSVIVTVTKNGVPVPYSASVHFRITSQLEDGE